MIEPEGQTVKVRPRRVRNARGLRLAMAFPLLLAAVADTLPAPGTWPQPQSVVFFTGNVQGYLEQCGCTRNPLGGLDRRSGYVAQVRRRWPAISRVLLDAGNFADTPGPAGDVKTKALVKLMGRLGYVASGVGERELLNGHDFFRQLSSEATFTFVSTNLVREADRSPWLAPQLLIDAGGIRIGLLAVTRHNPSLRVSLPDGGAVVTMDPAAAIGSRVAQLRETRDLVVVLATLPLEDARLLARKIPGIDLILGTHGGRVTDDAVVEGKTHIVYAGDEGKYVAEVGLYRGVSNGPVSMESKIASLGPSVTADVTIGAAVIEAMARSQDAELAARTAPVAGAEGRPSFLGSGACSACHAAIVAEFAQSDHARAYTNLVRRGPPQASCVVCHVTGHAQAGGFTEIRSTPHLAGVGCESCHGPGAAHVQEPQRPYGRVTLATCTVCHTAEMDPTFNCYEDRQLVRHSSADR
jgi:hypothetical protein